jgi:hypothetical protein
MAVRDLPRVPESRSFAPREDDELFQNIIHPSSLTIAPPSFSVPHPLAHVQTTEVNWEDQQHICAFGRFNTRLHEVNAELRAKAVRAPRSAVPPLVSRSSCVLTTTRRRARLRSIARSLVLTRRLARVRRAYPSLSLLDRK